MKKTKIIIILLISLITITPQIVTATPGKLKKASIIYCNNTRYGYHGKNNHWHTATSKGYATGSPLRVPCGLDNEKIISTKQTKKTITISYKKIKNISGYKIYRKTNKKYTKIATTTKIKYIYKNVKKRKTYTYKIKPYKKIGNKIYYGKAILKNKIKKM